MHRRATGDKTLHAMLRTRLCDLVGIDYPIVQAGMSRFTSAELVAAVSNAGALGSLGCDLRSVADLERQIDAIRRLTNRPFAINHFLPTLREDALRVTWASKPQVVSFAGGDPGDLVKQAHDFGARVLHQVQTVTQARMAANRGVDVIIAQGWEAGGHSGGVAALTLVPQVVDAVAPIPVIAAGGIADGRGLVAALALGADGVNVGTRFLASVEAPIHDAWKDLITKVESEDVVKVDVWNVINPLPGIPRGGTGLRVIRTPFIEHWQDQPLEAADKAELLRSDVAAASRDGRLHEMLPIAGQSAGLIRDIARADAIVRRMVAEAGSIVERMGACALERSGAPSS